MAARITGGWIAAVLLLLSAFCAAAADQAEKEKPEVRIARLVRALSHEEFVERERATESLIAEGPRALAAVRALFTARDAEVLYRARRVFQGIRGFGPDLEERVLALAGTLKTEAVPGVDREVAAIIDGGPAAVAFAADVLKEISTPQAVSFRDALLVRAALDDFERGRNAGAAGRFGRSRRAA